jgi:hypothetical protein
MSGQRPRRDGSAGSQDNSQGTAIYVTIRRYTIKREQQMSQGFRPSELEVTEGEVTVHTAARRRSGGAYAG